MEIRHHKTQQVLVRLNVDHLEGVALNRASLPGADLRNARLARAAFARPT